ncbi:MAG: hypothetical protein HGA86_04270, partial [Anaerolineaceae bacterium]|nr:hypothetical protein [Anaerolineaceae bacterium]
MENKGLQKWRVLIIAGISVFFTLGLILIIRVFTSPQPSQKTEVQDALASSTNSCVTCHRTTSPGIVDQYSKSSMAAAEVTCQNCHEVEKNYPGAVPHEGTFVLQSPSSAMCETCHTQEVAQFNQSRHALPSYVAVHGSTDLNPELMKKYQAIPEGSFAP